MYIYICIHVYSTHISYARYFVYELKQQTWEVTYVSARASAHLEAPCIQTHKLTRIYRSHHSYMSI